MNKEEKPMKLQGTFLYYDKENLNGQIYSKDIAKSIIKKFNNKKKNDQVVFGEFDPNYGDYGNDIRLRNVSHEVIEIHLNEETGTIDGTIKILDTPAGKTLKELFKYDTTSHLGVASRGYGNLNSSTNKVENYKLITFDIVSDLFFKNSNLKITDL